jgi:A/G-specific adenine glycosylase
MDQRLETAAPRGAQGSCRPALAGPLLRWFDRHRRDLPWRRSPSPYRTLVSELMLQQTVVATVEPYFQRFTARFPDLASLAAASEEEVIALWSGLGYYARARNLRRAAMTVVAQHGGQLPSDEEALRRLPGVGAYTAAAVAAIAFDRRTFALDGNGIRVLARLHAISEPVDRPATRARLRQLGQEAVPAARAGDFNQAVMELGALICAPRTPRCPVCPVRPSCAAAAAGLAAQLPNKPARAARLSVRVACALVMRRGRVLLVRRAAGELLAGTWALPSAAIEGQATPSSAARAAAAGRGIGAGRPTFRGRIRHVFTHRDLTAEIFAVPERAPPPPPRRAKGAAVLRDGDGDDARAGDHDGDPDHRWVDPGALHGLGISSFTRKTLATALGAGGAGNKRDKPKKRP